MSSILGIRSVVKKVNAVIPNNNSNYDNDEAGPSAVASLP